LSQTLRLRCVHQPPVIPDQQPPRSLHAGTCSCRAILESSTQELNPEQPERYVHTQSRQRPSGDVPKRESRLALRRTAPLATPRPAGGLCFGAGCRFDPPCKRGARTERWGGCARTEVPARPTPALGSAGPSARETLSGSVALLGPALFRNRDHEHRQGTFVQIRRRVNARRVTGVRLASTRAPTPTLCNHPERRRCADRRSLNAFKC
jgi:hypothetical protein